ncbi:MAG: hypothetical protein ACO20V_14575, partial [Alphaproteobacteria bacterium]
RVPTASTVLAKSNANTPQVCNRTPLAGNANAHINMARKQAKFAVTIPGAFFIQSINALKSAFDLYACDAVRDQYSSHHGNFRAAKLLSLFVLTETIQSH